jgi:glycosyltransferase involved in cell wall biosynthesis
VPKEEVLGFKQSLGLNGEPIIGAIARLSAVKGLDVVLKALPPLLAQFPRLQVLLVGDGPARPDLIRLAYSLCIAEHVVLCHPVEDARLALAAMELFLAPSVREGFGLAIVEAMAAGIPVVATTSGGPAEMIEDGENGILIPPGDPEGLAEVIRDLLSDPDRRRRIAQAGRERAKERFDMKRVVEEVEAVYARVLS